MVTVNFAVVEALGRGHPRLYGDLIARAANGAAAIRLIGAVLADTHDEWATDERRYLSEESMAKIGATEENPLSPLPTETGRQRR